MPILFLEPLAIRNECAFKKGRFREHIGKISMLKKHGAIRNIFKYALG